MALIQKTLFGENLDRYNTFVQDTDTNSKYFKITELPDTFTGGKNAFLIQGSEYLVADTLIKIELKDASGNIIYHEPGEGYFSSSLDNENGKPIITEYYEGVSKVVAVYIYPETSFGPCTLTILGELSEYDNNGLLTPIPVNWQGQYNVKWQKQINVNPSLANTTKIRFYKRPVATITEIVSPIYRIESGLKVDSGTNQSFADIKLSNLETFAGDVKRIKVFRTSEGDISDYNLIQDILVESKELLTSYGLSGSVVGNTGILTSETLKNYWNTGSLNTFLTSSRVEAGVRLTGSGYFTYTSSLDIKSANTYELNLDAFYSSSTSSNLGIYLNQITTSSDGITPTIISSSITTLVGTQPTKNLLDTVVPFKIDRNYPSASLYFSQSQGEWHVGNISLKLSQDTAFSPDEITFVTTMPTVIGDETYNFKFEFYDVNNNYVPVAVTQSLNFVGGTNTSNTALLISASFVSASNLINAVSSSISGTMTVYSSSADNTIVTLSGSVSGSITVVSGSVNTLSGSVSSSLTTLSSSFSQSNATILSSSFAQVKNLANGQFSGSFIGDTVIYSPAIGGQVGFIKELFTVGDTTAATINLDARTTTRKIYIGTGTYNNANTSVYMDSGGQFSLKDKLTWNGTNLSVNGSITITNPSTANNGGAVGSFSNGDAITGGSIAGVTIASTKIYIGTGTFANANTAFYVDNAGQFSLKDKLYWDGTTLNINGNITVSGGNAATTTQVSTAQTTANNAASAAATAQTTADTKITPSQVLSHIGGTNITTISGGKVTTGQIKSGNHGGIADGSNFSTAGMSIDLDGGGISAKNFRISSAGDAFFKGDISGASGTFSGTLSGATITGGTIAIGTGNNIFKANATDGISLGHATFGSAPFRVSIAGALTASSVSITGGSIAIGSNFSVDSSGNMVANNASMTGQVTATGGAIGGWTINSSQLIGSASAGQIVLDPTRPLIKFNNSTGATKLTIRTGQLTTLGGSGVTISMPSQNNSNTTYYSNVSNTTIGTATSVYIPSAGNYIGTPSFGGNGNTLFDTSAAFNGYFSVYFSIIIKDGSNYNTANTVGYISVGSDTAYGSGAQTGTLGIYPYNQTISFPSAGTYYLFPERSDFGSFSTGNVTTYLSGYTGNNSTFNPELDFGELTEFGLQVASSDAQFSKIQRGGSYAFESKGSIFVESPSGQFSYFNGVVHPYSNNTNDLGTTGNRWRTVWTNNPLNTTSDERLKNSIEDTDLGLNFINKLRPVKYKNNWATSPRYHYGLIAQELIGTLNDFNKTTSDVGFVASSSLSYTEEDIEGWKTREDWPVWESEISASIKGELGLAYTELISPMIKAIQQLSAKVEELEAKISGSV